MNRFYGLIKVFTSCSPDAIIEHMGEHFTSVNPSELKPGDIIDIQTDNGCTKVTKVARVHSY